MTLAVTMREVIMNLFLLSIIAIGSALNCLAGCSNSRWCSDTGGVSDSLLSLLRRGGRTALRMELAGGSVCSAMAGSVTVTVVVAILQSLLDSNHTES